MKWKTSISKADAAGNTIRGYDLQEMIGNLSFSEAVYLILKGDLPSGNEGKMMDAILVACIEHSIAPPSVMAARTAVSSGNPITVGMAAGILSIGEHHGGAVEQAAKVFQENAGRSADEVVAEFRKEGKRMPGFGHKVYATDPRAQELLTLAKKYGVYGRHCEFAEETEKELERSSGRKLCLNIDGAIAAIMSDLGFDWRIGKGIFALGRSAGILAHVHEEVTKEKPYRRIDESDVEYTGTEKRSLPQAYRKK